MRQTEKGGGRRERRVKTEKEAKDGIGVIIITLSTTT